MNKKILLIQLMVLVLLGGVFVTAYSVPPVQEVEVISKKGSTGEEVKKIQQKLKNWGYYTGEVDGVYGSKTQEAVKYFQSKNGLTADGIAGAQTLQAMGISTATGNYNQNERNLMARAINGEARGEPFEGQVAVGAVILNRVKHPSFPNSISGVIYQPGAFTAVSDGQIDAPMDESCYRAADMALKGADPSGGAIYYYNPAKATSKWIYTRQVIKKIGKHLFAI